MEKRRDQFVDRNLYSGERASFTADDLVELHARITEKPVIDLDDVELRPAYGMDGYRKGLFDFPNSIVSWSVTEIDRGVESPPHLQLHEATLFILQGKGYSVINGRRLDWEEGDVVFAPLFSRHQNGNDGREAVRYITAGTIPFFKHLGLYQEELGMEAEPRKLERLSAELPEKLVIKRQDWYPQTERGKSVAFDFPYKIGTNRIASSTPPNSPSKYVHRHFNEALIYVLQGEGYSLVHDRRVDWKAGSVLRVPTFCWHHHHNAASKPAIFLKNITSGLNNHLKWILMDNLPSREIEKTPLVTLAQENRSD